MGVLVIIEDRVMVWLVVLVLRIGGCEWEWYFGLKSLWVFSWLVN